MQTLGEALHTTGSGLTNRIIVGSNAIAGHALLGGILIGFALQGWLVFVGKFHWDEYYYLALIHNYIRGDLTAAMQTLHVQLFAWLTPIGDEHDQLIIGRLVMLGCEAISCISLYLIARAWTGRLAAIFAVLAYISAGMTLLHGASFRADPLALALVLGALAILARAAWSQWPLLIVSLLVALSVLVTIKVVFFVPAFLGIGAWRILAAERWRPMLLSALACAGASLALFVTIYFLHQASLAGASADQSGNMVGGAARKTLSGTEPFLRRQQLIDALVAAPVQAALLVLATGFAARALFERGSRAQALAVCGCVAPLLCLIFYRNAFAYFFPFITAPAFVATAWLAERRRWDGVLTLLLGVAMLGIGIAVVVLESVRGQQSQRSVVSAVHQIFPVPVATIDRNHMIATFPRRGFFMSTWGLEDYRARGPFVEAVLARGPVPLLLLNTPSLEDAVGTIPPIPEPYRLLEADRAALQDNFIPHWGPVWVAGKRLQPREIPSSFRIAIPGLYTLEGGSLLIDGRVVARGQTVRLSRGHHRLAGVPGTVRQLRWGDHLGRPLRAPPTDRIYSGF